jgi:hypothetical protein
MAVEAARSGDWSSVEKILLGISSGKVGTAKNHARQVRLFFEADEDTLWITFFQHRLWWCFSTQTISRTVDGHARAVIGRWSSLDAQGRPLRTSGLSGRLTAIQGFRGTLCALRDVDYLHTRLRGETPAPVRAAETARTAFEETIRRLIKMLPWHDFELFVDLLFRQAGLQRTSQLGATIKDIDLDLLSPLTDERYAVQVKSAAGRDELARLQDAFSHPHDYSRIYLVVHSPDQALGREVVHEPFELLGPNELAKLAVRHGLGEWLMGRSS